MSGCPRVRTTRGTGAECGDPRNRNCTVIIITHPFSGNEFNSQSASSVSGIFDIANPWQPSGNSYAVVKVTKDNGQVVESSFPTTLTTQSVGTIDNDTTPFVYVFQNPTNVSSFLSQSLTGEIDAKIEIEFAASILLANCDIDSGKYINHFRFSDSSGITYLHSFNLNYSVPDNVQGADRCDQASFTIE